MNLKKKKKGFTLIELMAVIAIIAVLAAVLVPSITGYVDRAKVSAVRSEARTLVNAAEVHNATVVSTGVLAETATVADICTAASEVDVNKIKRIETTTKLSVLRNLADGTTSDADIKAALAVDGRF